MDKSTLDIMIKAYRDSVVPNHDAWRDFIVALIDLEPLVVTDLIDPETSFWLGIQDLFDHVTAQGREELR
jgi:hypothetical protein